MEPTPTPKPPRNFIWPVAINLGLLLLGTLIWGADTLRFIILGLCLINAVVAVVMAFNKRMHYALAFVLSTVVVLLVGLGACFIILSNINIGGH